MEYRKRGVFSCVALSGLSVLSSVGVTGAPQPLDAASEAASNCGARRQTLYLTAET